MSKQDPVTGFRQVHIDLCRLHPVRMNEPLTKAEINHIALFREELCSFGMVVLHSTGNKLKPYDVWLGDDIVKAAHIAQLNTVWAFVDKFRPADKEIIEYGNNTVQADSNSTNTSIESIFNEAKKLEDSIKENNWSVLFASKQLGISREKLRNSLLLNKLDSSVKQKVIDGDLLKSHAIRIAPLQKNNQKEIAGSIVRSAKPISVRELENYISGKLSHEQLFQQGGQLAVNNIEKEISEAIGVSVKVNYQTRERGVMTLYCSDRNALLDFIETLGSGEQCLVRFSVKANESKKGKSEIIVYFENQEEFEGIMKRLEVDLSEL